jgi:hypothetical protein
MTGPLYRLFRSAVALTLLAAQASAEPARVAVFDFGARNENPSNALRERLAMLQNLVERELAASGRFATVDVAPVREVVARQGYLEGCGPCAADIARPLGADLALTGVMNRVTPMEQSLTVRLWRISDRTQAAGAVIDIRNDTDESWRRAGTALVRHQLLKTKFDGQSSAPASTAIAILDFDFRDTSGEQRDQTAEHAARLSRFMGILRDDLAASGKFRVIDMSCDSKPCSLRDQTAEEIFEKARQSGARLLVFGGIQKMSTLVQLGSLHVVDVENNTTLVERILSFRGDSDEAWRRAAKFVAKELEELEDASDAH